MSKSKFWRSSGEGVTVSDFLYYMNHGVSHIVSLNQSAERAGGEPLSREGFVKRVQADALRDYRQYSVKDLSATMKALQYCKKLSAILNSEPNVYRATRQLLIDLKKNSTHYKKEIQATLDEGLTDDERTFAESNAGGSSVDIILAKILVRKLKQRMFLSAHKPSENSDVLALMTMYKKDGFSDTTWATIREGLVDDFTVSPKHYSMYHKVFVDDMAKDRVILDKSEDPNLFGVRAVLNHYLKRKGNLHYKRQVSEILEASYYGDKTVVQIVGELSKAFTLDNQSSSNHKALTRKQGVAMRGDMAAIITVITDQTQDLSQKYQDIVRHTGSISSPK